MPVLPHNRALDEQILATLADGEMVTPTLAELIGDDKPRIYRRCRYLQDKGLLESELIQGDRRLFCVDHMVVLTTDNYSSHKGHDLRAIHPDVRLWGLTREAESTVH